MLDRRLRVLALICVAACSKGRTDTSKSAPSASAPAATAAPAPPPPTAHSPTDVPAKFKIDADGITLVEATSGAVVVKTTTLWNAPLEVTYESCDYYVRAVPVMERQVDPKRAAHFKEVCKDTKAPVDPTAAGTKSSKPAPTKAPATKPTAKPASNP
jgi:hypothetical protein